MGFKNRSAVLALAAAFVAADSWASGFTHQQLGGMNVVADGETLIARDASGRALWTRRADLPLPLQVRQSGGRFFINETLIVDSSGRSLEPSTDVIGSDAVADATAYAWDMPIPISAYETPSYVPQAFDAAGNAWTVVAAEKGTKSQVMKYVAKSGAWKSVKQLPGIFEYGRLDTDPLGNVTVVTLQATKDDTGQYQDYELLAVRYESDIGWGKPVVIYSEPYVPNSMVNFEVVGDKHGNAIVAAGDDGAGAITIVYNYASRQWLPAQPLSLPSNFVGGTVNRIALARSPNAQYIAVGYQGLVAVPEDPDAHIGYFSNAFDITNLAFGAAELVPKSTDLCGTDIPTQDVYENRLNFVIDNSGTQSLVWPSTPNLKSKKLRGTYASQRKSGAWKSPVKLSNQVYPLGIAFSSSAVDVSGRVAACTTQSVPGTTSSSQYIVFKYLPDKGWSVDFPASWEGTLFTRSRIAWFGNGQAVGTYLGEVEEANGPQTLTYSVFDGASWAPSAKIPPGGIVTFDQSLATSPSGSPQLLFIPVDDDYNGIVQATFLRAVHNSVNSY